MNKSTRMNAIRVNSVLILFIIANILNTIFPKGMGYGDNSGGWYEVSKYLYGGCILLMFPSLFSSRRYYFRYMQYMVFYIILHLSFAALMGFKFDFGRYLRMIMVCSSFVFFEEMLSKTKLNKYLLIAFMLSVFINVTYLVLISNHMEAAYETGDSGGGQSIANAIIYLLPLLFLKFEGKWASYLYLCGFFVVLISLRRTAILAYLFCAPFVYSQLKRDVSKRFIAVVVVVFGFLAWYVLTHYWTVIEMRWNATITPSDAGYYGSNRTGWWMALINNFFTSPQHWLQGFGLGQVALYMAKAGFPYGHAHNDYIEVGYTFGVVGMILWFGTIWKLYKLSKKRRYVRYTMLIRMATFSYLLVAIFSGVTSNVQFICIAIFAALIVSNRKKTKKKFFKDVKL